MLNQNENDPLKDLELVLLKSLIPEAVELAEITGEEVSLDPVTLGLPGWIEDLPPSEKGMVGKAIWEYFKMPTGNKLMKSLLSEKELSAPEGGTVPGKIRERIFETGVPNALLHELTFSDG